MRNLNDIFILNETNHNSWQLDVAVEGLIDGDSWPVYDHLISLLFEEISEINNYTKMPTSLFRFSGLAVLDDGTKPVINDIVNEALSFAKPKVFNDPLDPILREWMNLKQKSSVSKQDKRLFKYLKNSLESLRICCLSRRGDSIQLNPLMWAHYADEHRGVCLKFDLLNDLDTFYFPKKVDYNQTYLQYNYLQNPSKASEAIWHKSSDWAYEKEYRIIKPTYHGLMDVNPDAFVGVIIGCRCDKVDEQKIKDAIANIPYKNVVLQHASLNHTKYCLDIK